MKCMQLQVWRVSFVIGPRVSETVYSNAQVLLGYPWHSNYGEGPEVD